MNRATLLALAERVEAATGADRDIDHAIYAVANPAKPIPHDRRLLPWEHCYTASLDAAMSLYITIPERIPSNPRLATAEALRQRAIAGSMTDE